MKQFNRELSILNFELFQCYDLDTDKIRFDKRQKAKQIEERKKVLQDKLNKYH
jgi:hypothetical protein